MTDFNSLYLASFVLDAGTTLYRSSIENEQQAMQRRNANRQVAQNNNLAYNAFLHINEEESLEMKKLGLDKLALKAHIRREIAKEQALGASFGRALGRAGNTAKAIELNILRHGMFALARKDLNREIRMSSFDQRRKNVSLSTISNNNQILSNVPIDSQNSFVGPILEIAGTGIQHYVGSKKGTLASSGAADLNRGIA
jgi:hypothetical protein